MEYIYETLQVHTWHWGNVSWKRKTTLACLVFELSALDLVPYSKPCPGHNSLTIWNIFMKLQVHAWHWDDVSWTRKTTLACLVFELSALDLVPYSKPCPGHNSLTVWNIFMKLQVHAWHWDDVSWKRKTTLACLVFKLPALDLVPYSKQRVGHYS